jgi:hypothetical protein
MWLLVTPCLFMLLRKADLYARVVPLGIALGFAVYSAAMSQPRSHKSFLPCILSLQSLQVFLYFALSSICVASRDGPFFS